MGDPANQGATPPADGGGGGAGAAGPAAAGDGNGGLLATTPQWSSPVFFWGLGIGGLLILAGFASELFNLGTSPVTWLLLAAGLGIILGAFGSLALVKYQSITVAGVGALAIVLFLLLSGGAGRHLTIVVKGLPLDSQANLVIGHELHAGLVNSRREFVLLDNDPQAETLDFAASWNVIEDVEGEKKARTVEAVIQNVGVGNIRALIGGGRTTEWTFDPQARTLRIGGKTFRNGNNEEGGEQGGGQGATSLPHFGLGLVSQAAAQEAGADIPTLLQHLESDNLSVRRTARSALAEQGPVAIPYMMEFWRADPENYRRGLGVSVALTQYLRDNKGDWTAVSEKLGPEDYDLLVGATDHPDETLQEFATEFLFDLGAPESAEAIVKALPAATQDGQYNSIFVLTNVATRLDPTEKAELATDLMAPGVTSGFGPKTTVQFGKLLESLKVQ